MREERVREERVREERVREERRKELPSTPPKNIQIKFKFKPPINIWTVS